MEHYGDPNCIQHREKLWRLRLFLRVLSKKKKKLFFFFFGKLFNISSSRDKTRIVQFAPTTLLRSRCRNWIEIITRLEWLGPALVRLCGRSNLRAVVPYFLIRRGLPRRHHNTRTVYIRAPRSAVTCRRGYGTLGSPVNTSSPSQRSTSLSLPLSPLGPQPLRAPLFLVLSFRFTPVRYPRFRHIEEILRTYCWFHNFGSLPGRKPYVTGCSRVRRIVRSTWISLTNIVA